jgi:hypothetical protein
VVSKSKKWPETPFLLHCEEWRDIINLWDDVKPTLTAPWIEVDYYDLCKTPTKTAQRIAKFLDLDDDEVTLMGESFVGSRPGPSTNGEVGAIAINETGWSETQAQTFLEVCSPTMERCGYGFYRYWHTLEG